MSAKRGALRGSPSGPRIAYLTEWSPYEETGVLRKLIGQVQAWRELGSTAEVFSITPRQDRAPALDYMSYGRVFGLISQGLMRNLPFARLGYVNKVISAAQAAVAIRRFSPDLIYYRQNGPWYPGVEALLSIAPVIMEINTDEEAEAQLWGARLARMYRKTQHRVRARAAGYVCVTGEIARLYRAEGKPVRVIANSMWGDPRVALEPTGNDEPVFVFVGSRTVGADSWHGVDKLLELAGALPSCRFSVVGLEAGDFANFTIPSNVTFHGEKRGEDLIDIYRHSDVGIGSLALHRTNLEEACPLKTREYLMYGLPVIVGYTEAEVGLRGVDYVLELGNSPDNVRNNVGAIDAFARAWRGRRVDADLGFMSPRYKAAERLRFFEEIVSSARGA